MRMLRDFTEYAPGSRERSSAHDLRPRPVSAPVRVLLADRQGLAQRAVATLLSGLDGVVLTGVSANRAALADALERAQADVLVIDDRLLGDGAHILDGLGPLPAGMRVFVLGVDDDPAYAARASRLGAEAWIAKERADEQLPPLLAR